MPFIEILKILCFGVIEGITEWLPVSSTGHLILFNYFFPLKDVSSAFMDMFEYVIQLFAILAVVAVFWKKIFPLKTEKNEEGKTKILWKTETLSLWGKIIVACIPAVCALFVDELFENLTQTKEATIVASTLILYGVAFILVERFRKDAKPKVTEIASLSYKTAFFIGCFQVLAAIPGTSRSGITIIGALLLGVSRTTAAEFTFFLAIPTMVGASAFKLLKFFLSGASISGVELLALSLGGVVAFALSLLTIRFLMGFVKKHDFKIFGAYRIALGLLVLGAIVLPTL